MSRFSTLDEHRSVVLSDLDRTLLERCLTEEDGAWGEFVERYLPLITHVVTDSTSSKLGKVPGELRDDLVAEVLLAIVDRDFAVLRQFRGQSSLGTYLVVVARRVAAKKLAKLRKVTSEQLQQDVQDGVSRELSELADSEEEVHALLHKMPVEQADLIRMYHLEKQSYQAIGHHLGIPENSVGPMLSQARQQMRKLAND